jgi:hypothetical protein
MKNFIIALKNDTLRHFFLTILDRFKNHIFYERKRMKKLALFLTDVKKIDINVKFNFKATFINIVYAYFQPFWHKLKFNCVFV